ncbi:MAG: ABC transporter ATP-binding protein [Schwartzia sp.]|nr:ABC transporter ATP-binding protein [Schwartzia sp. (in: firmicutes)]
MALEAKNLTVTFEGRTILKNVNVSFTPGKRTAIIGPNGAGKSTLLKALSSLNRKYEGQVLLDREDVREMGRKKLSQRLAILPQGAQAPADVTVRQLVDFGRFPYRSWLRPGDPKADREAVEWALERTQLNDFVDRRVMRLSGGERQRAWIAMALAQKPEILLLDEPTTYLDIGHQLEVMNIVEELNRDYGITIIMVLHDINHALQYADEIVIIKEHGIFAQGTPKEILTVDMLAKVFGVEADIFVNSKGISVLSPVSLVK